MAQQEIVNYLLKKRGQFVSLPDLCNALTNHANRTNITRACKKMQKYGELETVHVKINNFTILLIRLK